MSSTRRRRESGTVFRRKTSVSSSAQGPSEREREVVCGGILSTQSDSGELSSRSSVEVSSRGRRGGSSSVASIVSRRDQPISGEHRGVAQNRAYRKKLSDAVDIDEREKTRRDGFTTRLGAYVGACPGRGHST